VLFNIEAGKRKLGNIERGKKQELNTHLKRSFNDKPTYEKREGLDD